MISLPFSQEMIDSAKLKAKSLGSINNSILRGAGNIAGYLGEEALAAYIDADIVSNNRGLDKYNHDLLLEDGHRIEVKTKRRTVAPKPHYDVSVAKTSKHQQPDIYAFISLEFDRATKDHPKKYYGLKRSGYAGLWERVTTGKWLSCGKADKLTKEIISKRMLTCIIYLYENYMKIFGN